MTTYIQSRNLDRAGEACDLDFMNERGLLCLPFPGPDKKVSSVRNVSICLHCLCGKREYPMWWNRIENKYWRFFLSDCISWWGTDQWGLLNVWNKEWLMGTLAAVPGYIEINHTALYLRGLDSWQSLNLLECLNCTSFTSLILLKRSSE